MPKVDIPELEIELERPVLEEIPDLDVADWTDKQIQDVTEVLSVYNLNLGRLAIYCTQLEDAYELQTEYLNQVIVILTGI